MNLVEKFNNVRNELPLNVRLVAVSKFHPVETIQQVYDAGQRIFGESKVQELSDKYDVLPKDIEWHFIGHLQTNKVKYIIPYISLIHSIDSIKLLEEVNKCASKAGKIINVLLQIHIAEEDTKYGFSKSECLDFLNSGISQNFKNINICGLMGMATFTDNTSQIKTEFSGLASFFQSVKQAYFQNDDNFRELSIGMSDDYPIAIECGSTLVRIGSKIFGERIY